MKTIYARVSDDAYRFLKESAERDRRSLAKELEVILIECCADDEWYQEQMDNL